MIIGKLNHRVTLLQYTVVSEDVGFGPQKDWAEVAMVWAQVHAPKFQAVAAVGSGDAVIITQGITIRKREDVNKGWRVRLDGRLYNILHVDSSKPAQLTLTTKPVEVDT